MKSLDWLNSLPERPCKERDQMVIDAISSGMLFCNWAEITSSSANHTAIFYVCEDAFYVDIGAGQRYRPQVSATLAQKCADIYGASLPTSKICDLSYLQAKVKLPPVIMAPNASMATTQASITYNKELERRRAGRTGLIRGVGKSWVISNKILTNFIAPNTACNYGYFDPNGPSRSVSGIRLWQSRGTRHNRLHEDRTQLLILMANYCKINDETMNVTDVMSHPILSTLISDEGPLKITRQPGV